jgi:hypothetical protein
MKGRGRGQLPPVDKAAAFLLHDSVSAIPTIASVTYDDPNGSGSWESWEPGGAWSNGSGGGQASGSKTQQQSESELRWDEDGDTNLRHPKQLPRTLITTSELDWEDSEECATELWSHPQRRTGREGHALPGRGRPQAAPDTNRGGRSGTRVNTGLRPTAGRAEARAPQTGPRPVAGAAGHAQRAAEPTARFRHGAPQRLPAAPPPRAAEPLPERRERTITQPGAATSQPPQQLPAAPRRNLQELEGDSFEAFGQPPQPLPAAPRRSLNETQVSGFAAPQQLPAAPQRSLYEPHVEEAQAPQQLPAAPRRSLQELPNGYGAPPHAPQEPRRSLLETQASGFEAPPQHLSAAPQRAQHETQASGIEAPAQPPQQQLSAAPRRSLNETQVSGFGATPTQTPVRETPAPGSFRSDAAFGSPSRHGLPPAPAIESLRGKIESTQRVLPPPRPQNSGHIPTILGTPSATSGLGHPGHRGHREHRGQPGRLPPPAAVMAPGAASTSVQAAAIEHLQEQLLEAMARSRVQEARAAEAEKSVGEVEEQLEAIVRSQVEESEQLQEQLRLMSEQLRVSELRAIEAERRSLVMERPSNMLHLDEPVLPRSNKQGRANLILSGLLASSLSFGGAAYFMFYAPLQKQLGVLEQQRVQDAQAQANAMTNLKAQTNGERQGLEAQAADLRKQLEAARAEAAAAAAPEEGRRGGRSRRASADADSEAAPAGTRSARAIERRMRRSRSAPSDDQETPAPARSSRSSRDNGDDPLGGI